MQTRISLRMHGKMFQGCWRRSGAYIRYMDIQIELNGASAVRHYSRRTDLGNNK